MACVSLGPLYIDRDHCGVDRDNKGWLLTYNLIPGMKPDNRLCSFETLCPGSSQALKVRAHPRFRQEPQIWPPPQALLTMHGITSAHPGSTFKFSSRVVSSC